jgi:cytochrome c-type biogenesis protein CcmE
MFAVGLVLFGVAVAATLASFAFQENLLYFYSPKQVAAGEAPIGKTFRLGGLVADGSVTRETGSMEVRFIVTDFAESMTVSYSGLLPDLFREGQGIIAHGQIDDNGVFVADEVLAKHDENYMPPEVAEALEDVHGSSETGGDTGDGSP